MPLVEEEDDCPAARPATAAAPGGCDAPAAPAPGRPSAPAGCRGQARRRFRAPATAAPAARVDSYRRRDARRSASLAQEGHEHPAVVVEEGADGGDSSSKAAVSEAIASASACRSWAACSGSSAVATLGRLIASSPIALPAWSGQALSLAGLRPFVISLRDYRRSEAPEEWPRGNGRLFQAGPPHRQAAHAGHLAESRRLG